jgi:hypothetical protein
MRHIYIIYYIHIPLYFKYTAVYHYDIVFACLVEDFVILLGVLPKNTPKHSQYDKFLWISPKKPPNCSPTSSLTVPIDEPNPMARKAIEKGLGESFYQYTCTQVHVAKHRQFGHDHGGTSIVFLGCDVTCLG